MAAQHSNSSVEEVVPLSGGLFALPDVVDVVASQLVPSNRSEFRRSIAGEH